MDKQRITYKAKLAESYCEKTADFISNGDSDSAKINLGDLYNCLIDILEEIGAPMPWEIPEKVLHEDVDVRELWYA